MAQKPGPSSPAMIPEAEKEESEPVAMPERVRPIEEALPGHKRYIELHQQGWNQWRNRR